MVRYGAAIQALSAFFKGSSFKSTDPSLDALVHLSLAWDAVTRLQNNGVDLSQGGQPLILPTVERAYREALHVRSTRVPKDQLDTSVLSKLGRINSGKSPVSDRTDK
jgi:hypothetical protein